MLMDANERRLLEEYGGIVICTIRGVVRESSKYMV